MARIFVAFAFLFLAPVANAQTGSPTPLNLPEFDRQLGLYTQQIQQRAASKNEPALDLFRKVRDALGAGKTEIAINALETLAGRRNGQAEGGARTWLRLALAWQSQTKASPRCEAPAEARVSAYAAYAKATTDADRIEALSLLGSMLLQGALDKSDNDPPDSGDQSNKPVSCKPLSEVSKADDKLIREGVRRQAYQVFMRLGELAGVQRVADKIKLLSDFFVDRITFPPPYAIDAQKGNRCPETFGPSPDPDSSTEVDIFKPVCEKDAANAVCVYFNRSPKGTTADEISRLVTLRRLRGPGNASGNRTPDDIRDNAVCFTDLTAGAEYELAVDKSTKSVDGVPLGRPARAVLQMPDSEPSLGFRPETYVLPTQGRKILTMRTVNVNHAQLMLRRVGDRNLVREIFYKNIVGSADRRNQCFILTKIGEKIADGEAAVRGTRNDVSPLDLPIGDILQARADWLGSDPRGGEKQWYGASLSLKLLADQASRDTAKQAGVFALFGTIRDNVDDYALRMDDDQACPSAIAVQWFSLTNLGITFQRGPLETYVVVRALDSGAAVSDATVELIARSGARLAAIKTDGGGVARLPARLVRGTEGNAPIALMAYRDTDFTFLDLTAGALDLSDRGFEGRGAPIEFDAFVAPSRGVYRPGETIQSLVFVRGPDGRATNAKGSFTIELSRNDGSVVSGSAKEYYFSAALPQTARDGGFLVDVSIPAGTAEGLFDLSVNAGGQKLGSAPIDIRYFQPRSVRIDEGAWSGVIGDTGSVELSGNAKASYLYSERQSNAPAANLHAELDVQITTAKSPRPGCFEDFTFGQQRQEFRTQLFRESAISTDSRGALEYRKTLEKIQPNAVPLQATVAISLIDPNGKAAERKFDVSLTQLGRRWIGLRFGGSPLAQLNQPTLFDVVTLDDKKEAERPQLWYSLYRERNSFIWYRTGNSWNFAASPGSKEAVVEHVPLPNPDAAAARQGDCLNSFSVPVKIDRPGNYLLVVSDDKNAITELPFSNGWTTGPDGNLRPDALRVWTQAKDPFNPGDTLNITVNTPHDTGKVLGQVFARGTMVDSFEGDISKHEVNVKVPVASTWPTGDTQIYVTSFRKADSKDDSVTGGPGRAIGGTSIHIGGAAKPTIKMDVPEHRTTSSAGQDFEIPIMLDGLRGDASVVLAIADEGILLFNDFKTPNPYEHYFGKRRFDFDVFDNYGRIIYGRYGADVLAPLRGVGYRSNELISWRSMIQTTVDNKTVFRIPANVIKPNFEGEIRVMAWAWNADTLVSAEGRMKVSDRLTIKLAAPRSITSGEVVTVPLQARLLSGQDIGPMPIDIRVTSPLALNEPANGKLVQSCPTATDRAKCQRIVVQPLKDADWVNSIQMHATPDLGPGTIQVQYILDGVAFIRQWEVPAHAPSPRIARLLPQQTIPPGGKKTIDKSEFDRMTSSFDPSQVSVSLKLSRAAPVANASYFVESETEVRQLDQLAAQAQLILAQSFTDQDRTDDSAVRLGKLVGEISALQGSDGGFTADSQMVRRFQAADTPYDPKKGAVGLTAFALDVLSRAKAAGVPVSTGTIDKGVGFLLSQLQPLVPVDPSPGQTAAECPRSQLYALAVLAKIDRIASGSFRVIARSCAPRSAADRIILASAYNSMGFKGDAGTLLSEAQIDQNALDGNTAENAKAAAFLLESRAVIDPAKLFDKIALTAGGNYDLATASWMTRLSNAALAILNKDQKAPSPPGIAVTPDRFKKRDISDGVEIKTLDRSSIPIEGIQIANTGDTPVVMSVLADGIPREMAAANLSVFDVKLKVNGKAVDPTQTLELKQLDRAYFLIEFNQRDSQPDQRLALVQILPTGFEGMDKIVEPSWSGRLGNDFDPRLLSEISYAEFQDGRWITVLPLTGYSEDPAVANPQQSGHLLGFSATPLLPGEFVLPPLLVRDLNDPRRLAWTKPGKVIVRPAN